MLFRSVIILVAIAVPSFKLLFLQLNVPQADVTVKATGKQWYWSYSYPDAKFEFDSLMLKEGERKPDQPRLLAVDNEMVVPVNKVIRVQVIGAEVIHAFAVPSFGIKIDAVPGRLNETWFKATREGMYYGQCSELCGRDHAYMPIEVRVVNVVNLMKLQPASEHPHGLSDHDYDALFTKDKPIIFAFHGYPWLIHRLTYRRTSHANLHVRGYKEEGTTSTPFDMCVLNDIDRFHLVSDVIDRVPKLGARAAYAKQAIRDRLIEHQEYIARHGDDMPGIANWKWGQAATGGGAGSTEADNV